MKNTQRRILKMSLQYDNDSPMTELDRLMQQNAEAVETIQLTPYQPIVWAIPDDIRQQEQALLEQAVEFQPELYRMISLRPTKMELGQAMAQHVRLLKDHNEQTMQSIQTALRQAGSEREQHSSAISKMLSESLTAMEDTATRLERRVRKLFAITVSASVVVSVLVCVVWQLLVS
jgi:Fe2+ transport system protein B